MRHIKKLGLIFALIFVCAGNSQATIIFSTDTATDLVGSWQAVGILPEESVDAVSFAPLLQDSSPSIVLQRQGRSLHFGTEAGGIPDNPFLIFGVPLIPTMFRDFSGMFNNNLSGTDVFFLFSNLGDTGGETFGTFTGDFCFSTDSTACSGGSIPEPTSLALIGLGLVGLGFNRKRKTV